MIVMHNSHAQASIDLGKQIAERFGIGPGIADLLHFGVLPLRGAEGGVAGYCLYALPAAGVRDEGDLLIALFGSIRSPRSNNLNPAICLTVPAGDTMGKTTRAGAGTI